MIIYLAMARSDAQTVSIEYAWLNDGPVFSRRIYHQSFGDNPGIFAGARPSEWVAVDPPIEWSREAFYSLAEVDTEKSRGYVFP